MIQNWKSNIYLNLKIQNVNKKLQIHFFNINIEISIFSIEI